MAATVIPNNTGRFRFEKLQVCSRFLTIIHFTEILKARSRLKSEMLFPLKWVRPWEEKSWNFIGDFFKHKANGRSMPDIFTKAKRSEVMSRIRSRGNKDTELALAKLFRRHKITSWRRHQPVFGKPDFIFPKLKLALFVDGCFWHGCPKHGTQPAGNRAFWKDKFARNKARDIMVTKTLRRADWHVLRLWEHELAKKNEARLLRRIHRAME